MVRDETRLRIIVTTTTDRGQVRTVVDWHNIPMRISEVLFIDSVKKVTLEYADHVTSYERKN